MATRDIPTAPVVWPWRAIAPRARRPIWLVLVLVGAALAVLAGYSIRPSLIVDVGARYDLTYLDGFHSREFSAIAPQISYEWPTGTDRMLITDGLNPAFRMATLTLDAWKPDQTNWRRLIAVYANEQQLTTLSDRGGGREFRVLLPDGASADDRLLLRVEALPDRTLDAPAVQVQSVKLSSARTYRWTREQATATFPALGRGPWLVDLNAVIAHPDRLPVQARLLANGVPVADLPSYADSRRLAILVPEPVVGGGDLTLTIESSVFSDPRPLGILVERIAVSPVVGSAGTALPPWSALLPALVVALCMYAPLRWLQVPGWLAACAGLAVAAVGGWAMAFYRIPMGFYLQPLALLMVFSAVLVPLTDRISAWAFQRMGIPLEPWLRRMLVLVFVAGFWLKGGGMVFPYMRSIDISWHMDRVRWILEGNWAAMYLPGTFSESVMPINEWGANRPVIPYSPFFHLFSTVFAIFPWPMELSANLTSALLDTVRVFLIAALAIKSGLSNRVALLAAVMYAATPFTFLLHSWGNAPTTFGIFWTLAATTAIVVLYPRLERPGPLTLLTAVTLITMLLYTVMAVFHVMFLICFLGIAWLLPDLHEKRPLRAVFLSTALAGLLALAIYYGQYIPAMIERTVPYVLTVFTRGSESVGVQRQPFSQYLLSYVPHLDYHMWPGDYLYYGVVIPALFAIPGFVALRKRTLLWAIMAAWYTIAVLFLIAGNRISMVDKQIFYVFPAICLCWALYADRYWRRGRWSQVMILVIYLFTLVSALDLWVIRIMRSPEM